jgi:predicted branched-subunit amino acid permease
VPRMLTGISGAGAPASTGAAPAMMALVVTAPRPAPEPEDARAAMRQGLAAAAPIAVGVVPFGLVAGAAPVEAGQGAIEAIGFSVFVFAGASQLAAIEILDGGGAVAVAVLSALMINLRMVMYSASLAPHLAESPTRHRLLAAYLLTDQAYALAVSRFGGAAPIDDPRLRLRFYLGTAFTFWVTWQVSTVIGALGGGSIPDSVPLDFAIPLAFLAILVPSVTDRPTLVAAVVGGVGTVAAAEAGVGDLSLVLGATAGIVAGALLDQETQPEGAVDDGGGPGPEQTDADS